MNCHAIAPLIRVKLFRLLQRAQACADRRLRVQSNLQSKYKAPLIGSGTSKSKQTIDCIYSRRGLPLEILRTMR